VTLPEETEASTLEDCGYFDWRQPFLDEYLREQILMKRIEKAQEQGSSDSATPSWKDSVIQRAR
jgi:hypothetical protein